MFLSKGFLWNCPIWNDTYNQLEVAGCLSDQVFDVTGCFGQSFTGTTLNDSVVQQIVQYYTRDSASCNPFYIEQYFNGKNNNSHAPCTMYLDDSQVFMGEYRVDPSLNGNTLVENILTELCRPISCVECTDWTM